MVSTQHLRRISRLTRIRPLRGLHRSTLTRRAVIGAAVAAVAHREAVIAVASAIVAGIAAFISIKLTQATIGVATIWPANGIVLAGLILLREQSWRCAALAGFAFTSFVANYLSSRGIGGDIAFAAINVFEVASAYWLLRQISPSPINFTKVQSLKQFVVVCGLAAPLLPSVVGATIVTSTFQTSFEESLRIWYLADALGLLILTPAIVLLFQQRHDATQARSQWEIAGLFVLVALATTLVFAQSSLPLMFMVMPVLVLVAFRAGPSCTAAAALLIATIALTMTAFGFGPATLGAGANVVARVEVVQLFILTAFLTALPLADMVAQETKLRSDLRKEVMLRDALTKNLQAQKRALRDQKAHAELAHNRLRDALDILPDGLVMLDAENRYITWNRKYAEIYADTADHLEVGATIEDATRAGLRRRVYPEAIGREEAWLAERLHRLKNPGAAHEQRLADGRCIQIKESRTSEGGIISLRSDITELKQREASVRMLFEDNPLPMFVLDRQTCFIRAANNAAVIDYGYTKREFLRMSFADVQPNLHTCNGDPEMLLELLKDGSATKHTRRDGKVIDVEIYSGLLTQDGHASLMIASIDVTERRAADRRTAYMARHDSLTNLPNRTLLAERMEIALARVKRGDRIALLFLDLDNFKVINDTLGHAAGDELLNVVADRLRDAVRETDTVARLGGDEFAILLIGADLPEGAVRVADRIIESVRMPIQLGQKEVAVGVSIGIAIAPDDGLASEDLLRYADLALYTAKHDERGTFRFFQKEMDERVRLRDVQESELRLAIDREEFEIHYQPIISLVTDVPVAAEALVRWPHPTRGLVPPAAFIPLAEETGLIRELGRQVLHRACREAANWPEHVSVAVNVSSREFGSEVFYQSVRDALDQSGLSARRLQIEVTESTLMRDCARSVAVLSSLRMLGVQIAMDDFGTGYSSLSALRTFPFDKIKIDRSFIKDLESSGEARAILETILDLAKTLGMRTTAEGVETIRQLEMVKALGCGEVQGYLLHRPLPLGQLHAVLGTAKARSVA